MTSSPAPQRLHGALSADDIARIEGIATRAEEVDGAAPLSEQFIVAMGSPDSWHVLSPHGYAGIVVPPAGGAASVEAVVDPEHRGHGEGARLVAEALGVGREVGDGEPVLWAHGDLPSAGGLAANLGLKRFRELLQLRRPLLTTGDTARPLPPIPERDGVVLRSYSGPRDDAEILRVNNAAFSWHPEQGGWTQRQIDDRLAAPWFDPTGLILAFDTTGATARDGGSRLLGFHWTKVHPPGEKGREALGEVYIVAVDPDSHGRGIGSQLTLAGLHYLAGLGLAEVELYVEGDNQPALNTYRKLGFAPYAVDAAYR